MKRYILLLFILHVQFSTLHLIYAQTTLRVLTIGNSFSEDAVEQNLYELGREAGYDFIIGNAYRGGQGLQSHWNVVSKGEADFEYRKVVGGQRTNQTHVQLDSIVRDEPWDIITFQQVSQDAGDYATYYPWLRYLINHVKGIVTGENVRYGFHQTWAYSADATHSGFAKYDRNQQKMYRSIVNAVKQAVKASTDLTFVVPAGTTIQNARTSGLGDYMNRDGYHLDYTVGRYAAACTWLEALTGHSPVESKYRPTTVSADQAAVVRHAAHDAIQRPDAITPQPAGIDSFRISMFGSSVAFGTGATDNHGYAYMYNQQLGQRTMDGQSQYPFSISNISVGGNTTVHLLNRYKDLIYDLSRYVVFGLSLGNEGIHDATDQQAVFERWRDNMQVLIGKARADGKIPVVMNNYTRADFNDSDYHYVKQLNLLIHEWDLPSVNTLGAIDDGAGHWAKNFENDFAHPNTPGHRELMYAVPPSLFDALAEGKPLPKRDRTQHTTLSGSDVFAFSGEGTVHPFAISLTIQGTTPGRLLTLHSGSRAAWVGINADRHLYYRTLTGDSIVHPTMLTAAWHTITLSHYYAQRRTLLFVDTDLVERSERIAIGRTTVGDESGSASGAGRTFGELFFWRSALNREEVEALTGGAMLKSSLELYMPLSDEQKHRPVNQAQSLNTAQFIPDISSAVRAYQSVGSDNAADAFDLLGRRLPAVHQPGIYIKGNRKVAKL